MIDDPTMRHLHWRPLVFACALPSAALLVLSYFVLVESPSYLALHNREAEAERVLARLRDENGVSNDVAVRFRKPARATEEGTLLGRLSVVFGRHYIVPTSVLGLSCICMNIVYYNGLYGVAQLLPQMELKLNAATNLMVGALMEVVGGLVAIALAGVLSKKTLMISSFLVMAACTLGLSCFASMAMRAGHALPGWVELLLQMSLFLYKITPALVYPVVCTYACEVYPTVARTTGSGVVLACGRVGAILCPLLHEALGDYTGGHEAFFYLLVTMSVACAAASLLLGAEGKGAVLHDNVEEAAPLAWKVDKCEAG